MDESVIPEPLRTTLKEHYGDKQPAGVLMVDVASTRESGSVCTKSYSLEPIRKRIAELAQVLDRGLYVAPGADPPTAETTADWKNDCACELRGIHFVLDALGIRL